MIIRLIGFSALCVMVSAVGCHDGVTWALEVAPVLVAAPFLIRHRSAIHPLLAVIIALHVLILCIGAHYSYERVPFGAALPFPGVHDRNNYDKIGHFFQGLTPGVIISGMVFRTFALRVSVIPVMLVIFAVLGISAFYEELEMAASMALGTQADAFLGTQGYAWDTQTDMLMAFLGGCLGLGMERIWSGRAGRDPSSHPQ